MRPILLFALAAPLLAQPREYSAADYGRAEKFLGPNTTPLVYRSGVRPNWMPDERFWYRITTPAGSEFWFVDPSKGTRVPAFDHARVAAALSTAANAQFEGSRLPFTEIELTADAQFV